MGAYLDCNIDSGHFLRCAPVETRAASVDRRGEGVCLDGVCVRRGRTVSKRKEREAPFNHQLYSVWVCARPNARRGASAIARLLSLYSPRACERQLCTVLSALGRLSTVEWRAPPPLASAHHSLQEKGARARERNCVM